MRGYKVLDSTCLLSLMLATSGCASLPTDSGLDPTTQPAATAAPATVGSISWRLPKTVVDVTATIKLKDCSVPTTGDDKGKIVLKLETTVAVVTRGTPDDYIFAPVEYTGDVPSAVIDPFVHVPVSALTSFWQDRSLTVHHNADGTLAQIGAQPEDQVAGIVGNVLTSAVKLASVALGVPGGVGAAAPSKPVCSTEAKDIRADMDAQNAVLVNPKTSVAEAAAANAALLADQKKLDGFTLALTKTLVPGEDKNYLTITAPNWQIGKIELDPKSDGDVAKVKALHWLKGTDADLMDEIGNHVKIGLFLDFARMNVPGFKADPSHPTNHHASIIDRNALFREPAYIPLIVALGYSPDDQKARLAFSVNGVKVDNSERGVSLPFAQFGTPRYLPIKAGVFQKLAWTYNFNQYGEYQDVSFGSSARGVKATSLLQSASTEASQMGTQVRTSNAAVSDETARLQAQAAADKAIVDAATYKDQADALRAQGKVPQ